MCQVSVRFVSFSGLGSVSSNKVGVVVVLVEKTFKGIGNFHATLTNKTSTSTLPKRSEKYKTFFSS